MQTLVWESCQQFLLSFKACVIYCDVHTCNWNASDKKPREYSKGKKEKNILATDVKEYCAEQHNWRIFKVEAGYMEGAWI